MENLSLSKAPLFCNPLHRRRSTTSATSPRRHSIRPPVTVALAPKGDDTHRYNSDSSGGGSRMVDENMVVLRKRIHEVRVAESTTSAAAVAADEPSSDWMEWEKRYYQDYGADVCHVVGLLQLALMNTRPSFAIGAIALVLLSLPTSIAVVFFHVIQWARHS